MVSRAADFQRWLAVIGLLLPLTVVIRLIAQGAAVIAIGAHGAIAVVAVHRATRRIHRNMAVVHTQAVALRITIREQAPLQHFVGRKTNTRHHIGGVEGRLLDFSKIVGGVAVEFHHADFDQRIVFMRPNFAQIKGVVRHFFSVQLGHDLHRQRPFWTLAALNRLV